MGWLKNLWNRWVGASEPPPTFCVRSGIISLPGQGAQTIQWSQPLIGWEPSEGTGSATLIWQIQGNSLCNYSWIAPLGQEIYDATNNRKLVSLQRFASAGADSIVNIQVWRLSDGAVTVTPDDVVAQWEPTNVSWAPAGINRTQQFYWNTQSGFVSHEASARARELLIDWLTPEQRASYLDKNEFEVIGSNGGRYLIKPALVYGVFQLEGQLPRALSLHGPAKNRKAKLCFVPQGALAIADIMLAQKIALENDEQTCLSIANAMWEPTLCTAREPETNQQAPQWQ